MTEDVQVRRRRHGRLWLALALLVALLAVAILPPLVSLSRYKSRITQLMASSLGRPVRLSSVELRLLPRPGFVLTDLTVEDDPAFGAEPVLHANTVIASIRLLSLWRGRLEISRISVDEASLNLVRTEAGRWNLDTLLVSAAAHAGSGPAGGGQSGSDGRKMPFPYLEATNSRINIKRDAEKLPLSMVNTDLSFWQDEPGAWRIRLRGQPARTDASLDSVDNGAGVVQLEASVQRAAELRQMPVHLDMEWQEAQLGQLTRLAIGSDPGWRGDLTGELHLDGTADAAQIKTRLRATGVHRAEFAPAAPMDFDATCGFIYHFSERALENLVCNSPLGDGRIRLAGDLPGRASPPRFSVELDRIPVAAGLDALRTVRGGLGPGLEVKGTVSGKITYAQSTPVEITASGAQEKPGPGAKRVKAGAKRGKPRFAKARPASPGPLKGSITIEDFQLSGEGISLPIQAQRMVLAPEAAAELDQAAAQNSGQSEVGASAAALVGTVAVPFGGTGPLTVSSRLTLSGYQVTVRGQAGFARARELARVAGMADAAVLDSLAGDPVVLDLDAEGPWLPPQAIPFSKTGLAPAVPSTNLPTVPQPGADAIAGNEAAGLVTDSLSDRLTGTVILHNANWKAGYLASHVEIAQATLHLDQGELRWDPVVFSYGPVKGTASLILPASCDATQPCPTKAAPTFKVQFGALDAGALQAAILGAHERGTLLTELIARLTPSSSTPAWPQIEGTVKADSLILGPVTLRQATATLRILESGAEITGLDASLLGGRVHGAGTLHAAESSQGKPAYTLEGQFEKLNPAAVGQLLGLRCAGGALDADGKITLSGFTGEDLTESAQGTLHFEWRHGAVSEQAEPASVLTARMPAQAAYLPPALIRFDRWTADAEIANGTITLKQNQVQQGGRKQPVEAVVTLGDPPAVTFAVPGETLAKKP